MRGVEVRLRTIKAHLDAVSRGGRIDDDTLAVWLRELEQIDDEDLDARIRKARDEHADRVENGKGWGRITPDDVLRVHRRARVKSGLAAPSAPENPDCPHRCASGRVSLFDPEDFVICVRCSCFAGDYWKASPVWGAQDNVAAFLTRPGWRYVRADQGLPQSHRKWISARAEKVGPEQAMEDYRSELEQRAK